MADYEVNPLMVETADGSKTLYLKELNEQYHSLNGAVTESEHVFLRNGLYAVTDKPEITLLEIGFGTGLNCLLTYLHSTRKIRYVSIEKFILGNDVTVNLGYSLLGGGDFYSQMHNAPWNRETILAPGFSLLKLHRDLMEMDELPVDSVDLIYYDAFGPDKQPGMWSDEVMGHIVKYLAQGGLLVTYTAKGEVRRRLQRLGLTVERLPGPPGKREMLRAIKPVQIS